MFHNKLNSYCWILGTPSKKEIEAYAAQELERLETQRNSLGRKGLADKADELAAALEHNDRQASVDLIMSVPIPGMISISITIRFDDTAILKKHQVDRFPGELERIPPPAFPSSENCPFSSMKNMINAVKILHHIDQSQDGVIRTQKLWMCEIEFICIRFRYLREEFF